MTYREAIECMQYLDEHRHGILFKSLVDIDQREIISEGVRLAISALQEREKRNKGCEYCYDAVFNPSFLVYSFCPMCGRKLKGAEHD